MNHAIKSVFIAALCLFSTRSFALRAVKFADCPTRSLEIRLNVQDRTPKTELVDAIQVLSKASAFQVMPVSSPTTLQRPDELTYRATFISWCADDKCLQKRDWYRLQARLARYQGVRLTCAKPTAAPGASAPRMPMPGGQGEDPKNPPPPGEGGVTGGN